MQQELSAYIGVYGGLLCGAIGWVLGRFFANKNRGIDELYKHIWQKARSISWIVTFISIYLLFTVLLFGLKINAFEMLSILLFVHIMSWGISGLIVSLKIATPLSPPKQYLTISIVISCVILLLFLLVSFLTGNWKYFIFSLFPAFLTPIAGYTGMKKKDTGVPR